MFSTNPDIKKLVSWLTTQKQTYKNNTKIMKNPEIKLKYEEFLNEYREYFISPKEKWNIDFEKVKKHIDDNGNRPREHSKNIEEKRICYKKCNCKNRKF